MARGVGGIARWEYHDDVITKLRQWRGVSRSCTETSAEDLSHALPCVRPGLSLGDIHKVSSSRTHAVGNPRRNSVVQWRGWGRAKFRRRQLP